MIDHRPRLGVSACLLGQRVRFDGQHARDRFVTDTLGALFEWVPICPEIEAGLGAPRPTIRLVRRDGLVRLETSRDAVDRTEPIDAAIARRLPELASLSGYILKKDSPTCGLARVRVYEPEGGATRDGSGRLVEAIRATCPDLPLEEEGRLNDPALRENFLTRVFTFHRWREVRAKGTVAALQLFHAEHKMLLMAHEPVVARALGRVVAGAAADPPRAFAEYQSQMMAALSRLAPRRRHVDVLQHLAGHAKQRLDAAARAELHHLIEEYRQGYVALETPLALLRHHLKQAGAVWALAQRYLEPHPRALGLRNTVLA